MFIVYETTNTLNGKIYVGVHKVGALEEDGYLGSGLRIRRAVEKQGASAFTRRTLFSFEEAADAYAKEAEIVTQEFCDRLDTYNLRPGGRGNWTKAVQAAGAKAGLEARLRLAKTDPTFRARLVKKGITTLALLRAQGRIKFDGFKGRKHSEETRVKMSESCKVSNAGPSNSQFGTIWVCRADEAPRKIPRADLDAHLAEGWHKGRKPTPPKARERQWVHREGERPRQVPLSQLESLIEDGWSLGRGVF